MQFETRQGLNLSAAQPGRTAACARITLWAAPSGALLPYESLLFEEKVAPTVLTPPLRVTFEAFYGGFEEDFESFESLSRELRSLRA